MYNGTDLINKEYNMKIRFLLSFLVICILSSLPALAIDFTDANGREVSIDSPQRVVSLYNSYGDAWLLSGGKLVGTISDTFENPLLADDVRDLGSHLSPNMELLFSLEPDFVLLAANVSTHSEIGAVLEQAGISHAYFHTPDWRSYMDAIRLFTRITGREDLLQAQVDAVQKPIEAILAETEASETYEKVTALYLRANSSKVKAKNSEGTVAGIILKEMGFVNLADSDSLLSENLSMEAILMADPDYIFIVFQGSDTDAARHALESMLTQHPAWSTLTAVRENRCIILDRELFHYHPNDRWAEAYAFIADLIKGDNF